MSEDGFLLELALIGVLIVLNGFFAGAEIAVISARVGRIRPLAERGDRGAESLLRLKANPDRFLATVQIGVTVVGTLASAVGGVAAVERLEPLFASLPAPWLREAAEPLAVGSVVFVIAYTSLVVGELAPKSLAVRHAETLALLAARPIEWLSRISRVAVTVLTASTGLLLRMVGQRTKAERPFHTVEDLRAVVREAERQGLVAGSLVRGAFDIHDVSSREIMTPRSRVVGIERGATLQEAVRVARESGYSRLPVYERTLDDVSGMVHARDLYEAVLRGGVEGIAALLRPVIVVPETKKADELLAEMRRRGTHMTLVVDEHGSCVGIATLEDLFEIIVGDIEDEHESPAERVRLPSEGVLDVDAAVPVRELNAEHDLVLPESDSYVTVAGLVLDRLGRLPRGGEQVEEPPYRLTVVGCEGRRITRVRIEKLA